MIKVYNDPEFKVIKMGNEDILTGSTLNDYTNGWEVDEIIPGNELSPFIEI